jgi:hypothetical protein
VSFDLYFLERESGETWQDAMDRVEEAAANPSPLDDADLASWDAVREQVRPLLPHAEEFTGESHRELSDDASGIQLSLSHGELSLATPYWYSGPAAQAMVDRLRAVAIAVETGTGLTAYDPQADAPFVSGGDRTATAIFDQVDVAVRPSAECSDRAKATDQPGRFRRLFRRSSSPFAAWHTQTTISCQHGTPTKGDA